MAAIDEATVRKVLAALRSETAELSERVRPDLDTALKEFDAWMASQGAMARTRQGYLWHISAMNAKYGVDPLALTSVGMLNWAHQHAGKLKPRTLASRYSALRKWGEFTGQLSAVEGLRAPRIDTTPKPLPPSSDLLAIRDAMRPSKHAKSMRAIKMRRDGTIFDLLLEAALRASEVINLEVNNLLTYADGGVRTWSPGAPLTHVWVESSKRGKSRRVPLSPSAARSLSMWVAIHRPKWIGTKNRADSRYVFTSTVGTRFNYTTLRRMLLKYGDAAGVTSVGGRTHTGRRHRITELIRAGAKPSAIIRATGHKSIKELEPYIVLADEDADTEFLKRKRSR